MSDNVLYYGDNLDILRRHIKDETVDLVYLDPPFNSNADYNVIFAEQNGSRSAAQIRAFEDTWHWDQTSARAYQETVESGTEKVSKAMQALRMFLGETDMMAYLAMMAPRLVELTRILKSTGSLYLHCDPTASHYLKLLMDGLFGAANFRNEIVWERTTGRKGGRQFGRVHDIILFYTKSKDSTWHCPSVPQSAASARGHDLVKDDQGRICRLSDLTGAGQGPPRRFGDRTVRPPTGRHWMYDQAGIDKFMREGRIAFSRGGLPRLRTPLEDLPGIAVRDVWADIQPINAAAAERLGYPTQKPEALLERIINASSNEGDLVLDPFCGCGTTIVVAEKFKRHWIGVDITHLAVTLMKRRLRDAFGHQVSYKVVGEPVSISDAKTLARQDPYQFQWWALGMAEARPVEQKKGADRGIDGRLYFHDEAEGGKTKQIIIQVKAGHVTPGHVRDLRGVLDRESAEIGALITLDPPTAAMRTEAASSGFYDSPWGKKYPRIQILTITEFLAGKRIDYPPSRQTNVTFRKAPRVREPESASEYLPFGDKK